MSCYRLVKAEKANFPVSLMCRMLRVSRSGYYDWRNRAPSRRSLEEESLTGKIVEIHQRSRGTYGSPRIHAELGSGSALLQEEGSETHAKSRAARLRAR